MFGSPSTGLLRIAKVGTLSTIDPISVNIVRTIYNLVESDIWRQMLDTVKLFVVYITHTHRA